MNDRLSVVNTFNCSMRSIFPVKHGRMMADMVDIHGEMMADKRGLPLRWLRPFVLKQALSMH